MKIEPWQLKQRQGLPLEIKEGLTYNRIRSWYEHWNGEVYVSFSGGKDSTVLLHQVRKYYPRVKACFVDTGLEYPEIRDFVKTIDNVVWLKPKMHFKAVIEKYGYPIISKETAEKINEIRTTKSEYLKNKRLHGDEKGNGKLAEKWKYLINSQFKISSKCCAVMKKRPLAAFEKKTGLKPYVGIMTYESRLREQSVLANGCNAFNIGKPQSRPLAFWFDEDVWGYIRKYNIPYSKIYDMGYDRTGCMFCMFGAHLEKGQNRFQRMSQTHPKQYKFCIEALGLGEVLDFIGVEYKTYTP